MRLRSCDSFLLMKAPYIFVCFHVMKWERKKYDAWHVTQELLALTWHSYSRKFVKTALFCELFNALGAVEMFDDSVLCKSTITIEQQTTANTMDQTRKVHYPWAESCMRQLPTWSSWRQTPAFWRDLDSPRPSSLVAEPLAGLESATHRRTCIYSVKWQTLCKKRKGKVH